LGILNEFERRLEGMIEGVFTKAFRTGLQPVQLARRILKEMDTNKTVGVRGVWVPNGYLFGLSPSDRDKFQQAEKALRSELEQVVRDGASERGWVLLGPPEVQFETAPSLRQGEFTCEAFLVEGPTPEPAPKSAPDGSAGPAELVLIEDGKPGRVFPLTKDLMVIGRLADSDVPLQDPGASRRHAELRREEGRVVIADLGSTNGTLVNEATVDERELEEGDRITIGRTVLEFRRR
jgi:hypothetical protein